MTAVPAALRETVDLLKAEVAALHAELPRNGLVVWTAGNVSARVPGAELLVIKPSGVSYDELSPEAMVVCDFDANLVEGTRNPSSDTAAHAYVYAHMPEVGGVVHTHSDYATAWAARREPIPCVLTMIADEFGGEIPVGPFALIGDDSIGRGIVETLIGGASTTGGIGRIGGAMIGGMIMAVMSNIMQLMGWPQPTQKVARGLVLLLAVAFDLWNRRRSEVAA